jgi:anti-anti-sigma factor
MALAIDASEFGPFRCEVEAARNSVYVRPIGELDIAGVPVVAEQLRELRDAGFESILVDLRATAFLDSCGLRLVLSWTELACEEGFVFQVIPGRPAVQRIFEITDTTRQVSFVDPTSLRIATPAFGALGGERVDPARQGPLSAG